MRRCMVICENLVPSLGFCKIPRAQSRYFPKEGLVNNFSKIPWLIVHWKWAISRSRVLIWRHAPETANIILQSQSYSPPILFLLAMWMLLCQRGFLVRTWCNLSRNQHIASSRFPCLPVPIGIQVVLSPSKNLQIHPLGGDQNNACLGEHDQSVAKKTWVSLETSR